MGRSIHLFSAVAALPTPPWRGAARTATPNDRVTSKLCQRYQLQLFTYDNGLYFCLFLRGSTQAGEKKI
ncbi:hypothetical protein GWI33_020414 [Rhynchophorus ferrugineus]|uniref:Uncharacterized protein n=1 Tax=Rhynchophorus ferrugineus TaxID=354439 RepID=A0A834HQM2_RHYFE|nr:hypothetical protein GWI33_020414 [Rhynchophorus ferrugineus]